MEQLVWNRFLAWLYEGDINGDKVRPFLDRLREPLLSVLRTLKERVPRRAWPTHPKAYAFDDQVSYVADLHMDGTRPFCFVFTTAEGDWFLRHIEQIHLLLEVPECPSSAFADLPEETKAFMREELAATEKVRLFTYLQKQRGREFALDWFRDGAGYYLAARTWVPFLPPHLAFILYACWEQQRLRGSRITLEKLEDCDATIRMSPMSLVVYAQATHLRQQLPFEDYRDMFERTWQDRAMNAGWQLKIAYEHQTGAGQQPIPDLWQDPCAVFTFTRSG